MQTKCKTKCKTQDEQKYTGTELDDDRGMPPRQRKRIQPTPMKPVYVVVRSTGYGVFVMLLTGDWLLSNSQAYVPCVHK